MSFRYHYSTLNYYFKRGEKRLERLRTNNIGTRDSHSQTIIDELIDMNEFLLARLYCVAENVYIPEGVKDR